MVPFNLQLELSDKLTTISAEQLDHLADTSGFIRFQIRTFQDTAIVYVNVEADQLLPDDIAGYSDTDIFSVTEIAAIAGAIRQHCSDRTLNFDQMAFDF